MSGVLAGQLSYLRIGLTCLRTPEEVMRDTLEIGNKTSANADHLRFVGCLLHDTQLHSAKMSGCKFEQCTFHNFSLQAGQLDDCIFESCSFRDSSFVGTQFLRCRVVQASMCNVDFRGCRFAESTVEIVSGEHLQLSRARFDSASGLPAEWLPLMVSPEAERKMFEDLENE